ncbi:hypothetical protein CEXT_177991 [Caerostris extrusa]|uniref:Ribosomal protein S10 n=1 Tax=Caerostris extrusa TaxID=172846 RepID=A0AAV4SQT6_CAEEX|nr:hypothetical protein CEXT_177991 [Caerostris extrusa]
MPLTQFGNKEALHMTVGTTRFPSEIPVHKVDGKLPVRTHLMLLKTSPPAEIRRNVFLCSSFVEIRRSSRLQKRCPGPKFDQRPRRLPSSSRIRPRGKRKPVISPSLTKVEIKE